MREVVVIMLLNFLLFFKPKLFSSRQAKKVKKKDKVLISEQRIKKYARGEHAKVRVSLVLDRPRVNTYTYFL